MTPDHTRLDLVTGSCPSCGHAVLNHRKGVCQVLVMSGGLPKPCGCVAILPPNMQGLQQKLSL